MEKELLARGMPCAYNSIITVSGEINLDFADVKAVMAGMGMALMGTGIADGEHRAVDAAQRAISSPLLEDASIHGARGVLINICGGEDMSLHEVSEAAEIIQEAADPNANIIFGTVIDRNLQGLIKVTVIATGFHESDAQRLDQAMPLEEAAPPAHTAHGAGGFERPAARDRELFMRPETRDLPDLDPSEDGHMPNFADRKDDLDVPSFLRKQMD